MSVQLMWIDQWLMIRGEMTLPGLIVYIVHINLGNVAKPAKLLLIQGCDIYTSVVNVHKLAKLHFIKAKSCLSLL